MYKRQLPTPPSKTILIAEDTESNFILINAILGRLYRLKHAKEDVYKRQAEVRAVDAELLETRHNPTQHFMDFISFGNNGQLAVEREMCIRDRALNAKVESCQKQYVLLQTAFDSRKTSYDDIRTLYDKQKEAVEEWAKETRSRLCLLYTSSTFLTFIGVSL